MELQDHWILAQDTTSETSVIQEPFPLIWVECHAISWQGFTDWVHWESHGSPVPCLLFSRSVVSVSLQPHGLKHARLPCPSLSPRVYSNSCPLSQWCHPTISILCHPLLLLPSIFPSSRVFSSESVLCIRWSKYWSFSFNISPSNEYSGFISFRIHWFYLFDVQRIFKSLLQHHSSKVSILWHSYT